MEVFLSSREVILSNCCPWLSERNAANVEFIARMHFESFHCAAAVLVVVLEDADAMVLLLTSVKRAVHGVGGERGGEGGGDACQRFGDDVCKESEKGFYSKKEKGPGPLGSHALPHAIR
jgi:hypothetical protein